MAYATLADMELRYGADTMVELTDRLGTGIADATVAAVAIAEAGAEIDTYLAARYALPLATVPSILTTVACDVARYRLETDTPMEETRKRYELARGLLDRMAAGKLSLGLPAVDAAPAPVGGGVMSRGTAAVFD